MDSNAVFMTKSENENAIIIIFTNIGTFIDPKLNKIGVTKLGCGTPVSYTV